ncbi:MAG: hypothetical protein N3G79_02815 [Sulfolobales archaeon]|nr:hypothetical protein [Sulfolobales archaeon]
MKISRYLKLLKIARYAPVIALAVSAVLSSEIGTTGERIPKGEDPSIF